MSINFTSIKEGFANGVYFASEKAGNLFSGIKEWGGRAVTVIKSGVEKGLPYVQQDSRIAAGALVLSNLILFQLADISGRIISKILPRNTATQELVSDSLTLGAGLVVWVGGVAALTAYAKPALNVWAVVGISITTVMIRSLFSS